MAPHPRGEAASFANAFHECTLGLRNIAADDLDDSARRWLRTIQQAVDVTNVQPVGGRGAWEMKVEGMSLDERQQVASAVDELTDWFRSKFHKL